MEIKDEEIKTDQKKKSSAEKSVRTFFSAAGIIIILTGVNFGLLTDLSAVVTNVALGVIVIGIGEILRYLNKISNRE